MSSRRLEERRVCEERRKERVLTNANWSLLTEMISPTLSLCRLRPRNSFHCDRLSYVACRNVIAGTSIRVDAHFSFCKRTNCIKQSRRSKNNL